MAGQNVEVAVMFADVTDSTKLYETLGDAVANRAIGKAIDIMRTLTEMHGGTVIKTIGDEIMCRFTTADDCVTTAMEIQEELDQGIQGEEVKIKVKIGLDFGPAILMEDGDVFGDTVNVAARMIGIASGEQIITTEATVGVLSPDLADATRPFDRTQVKGKAEDIVVHQVIWENEDLTKIEITTAPEAEETKYLELSFQEQQHRISSDDHRVFIIGRGVQSDMVANLRLASRVHARIEFRRGKFLLTDQSSNGTYVLTDDGEDIYLRRQEFMLWGSGRIGLGEQVGESTEDTIKFVCPN